MDITRISSAGSNPTPPAPQQLAAQQIPAPHQPDKETTPPNTPATALKGQTDTVKIASSVTSKHLETARAIEQRHFVLNQVTNGVRETSENLNQAVEQTKQMQQTTVAIKNFPPFPRESEERQQMLMSYSSLKKEILKLTVPPPPPPIYEHVKSLWESTIGKNGQILPQAVPSLATSSSEQDVQEAGTALEQLGKSLSTLSSATTQALRTP